MGDTETEKKKKRQLPGDQKTRIFELARQLTSFCCPTGFEDAIRTFLVSRLKITCNVQTDRMGNVIAGIQGTAPSPRKRIMLSAHLDEIGFMVSYITKDGFLRIAPLGGQNPRVLAGQRVIVTSSKGEFRGVIAEKPIHLLDEDDRKKLVKQDELFVDIGASSKEDALEIVNIGDFITFQPQCEWLGKGDVFSCKAADNRIGVLVLLLALEHLAANPPFWDVTGVFSTQEEIGVRGITTSTYNVDPDAAIVLETTHAIDYPGISREKFGDMDLHAGPGITIGPNLHPRLVKHVMKTAESCQIPFQVRVTSGLASNEARQIQVTRKGVATALITVPLRYMHTNIEAVSPVDINDAL
ncbi:MAG: M42 family metallopeptidase, partial [Candidatus Lokiarchaeota archaeon]|nr:M42 family metallopeptidase [Candidatus Lokiarchaeota archaeon]